MRFLQVRADMCQDTSIHGILARNEYPMIAKKNLKMAA